MKRFIALFALVLSLAACSGSDEPGQVITDVTAPAPTAPGTKNRPADPKSATALPAKLAPTDGAASKRLPMVAEPGNDLRDGQQIIVRAAGFTPGATIAGAQCWTPDGSPGGADSCDLGTMAVGGTVRPDGTIDVPVRARQVISVGGRRVDCAAQGAESLCRVGLANVKNYDESGVVFLTFVPSAGADEPPVIEAWPTEGVADGEAIVVTGAGFVPNETVQIAVCVLGGMSGFDLCFARNPVHVVQADANGAFAASIKATRTVQSAGGGSDRATGNIVAGGTADCHSDPYGCRILVRSRRSPNAVKLQFSA